MQTSQLSRFHSKTKGFVPSLKVSLSDTNFSSSHSRSHGFSKLLAENKLQPTIIHPVDEDISYVDVLFKKA